MTTSECIITALSSIVNMRLVFMCQVKRKNELYFLCLSKHQFFFISQDFENVKDKVHYAHIERLVIDANNNELVEIELSEDRPVNSPKKLVFTTALVKNLVDNFVCYWQTDYMFRMGEFKQFPLKKGGELIIPKLFSGGEEKTEAMTIKLKEAEFQRKLAPRLLRPDNSMKHSMKGYNYYLPRIFSAKSGSAAGQFVSKGEGVLGARGDISLTVQVSDQMPIELLASRKEDKGQISEIAEKYAESIVSKEGEGSIKDGHKYWLMYSRPYMKKRNLMSDKSSWEGWEVHIRTTGEDIFVIMIRRKFLPPSMDHYTDLIFTLVAPFDAAVFKQQILEALEENDQVEEDKGQNDDLDDVFSDEDEKESIQDAPKQSIQRQKTQMLPLKTKKTMNLFKTERLLAPMETLDMPNPYDQQNEELLVDSSKDAYDTLLETVDSLHPISQANELLKEIINKRAESLLMTEETAYFYQSQLDVKPIQTEIMAIKILRRVLYLLFKNNNQERLRLMIIQLCKKLKKLTAGAEGKDRLIIERKTCQDIFKEYLEQEKCQNDGTELIPGEIHYRDKIARYLSYCVDGGLLFEDFNITQMLDLMSNLDPRDHDEIKYVVGIMLQFHKVGQEYKEVSIADSINRMLQSTQVPVDDQQGRAEEAGQGGDIEDEEALVPDSFTFIDRTMEKLVQHDWLTNHINEPYFYTKFFNLILRPDTEWSSDRIRAAVLQKINKIYEESSKASQDEGAGKAKSDDLQLGIVSPTIGVYHRSHSKRLCILAGQALFNMSNIGTYRMFMMRQGVVDAIRFRKEANDPGIVEISILLLNALTSNKDACNLLFQRIQVKKVVSELLYKVKGDITTIPGAFFSGKTSTFALATIYHIVKLQHKNAVQHNDEAIRVIVGKLNPHQYQTKQSAINITEGEKLIFMILETLARGSSPDYKDHLSEITLPSIVKRIERAEAKNEELERSESTIAMLAYFKTVTKDSSRAQQGLQEILGFLQAAVKVKQNGKLPLILLQRSGILG